MATNGAFVNGIAVFPKVTYAFSEDLYLRAGVLVADTPLAQVARAALAGD